MYLDGQSQGRTLLESEGVRRVRMIPKGSKQQIGFSRIQCLCGAAVAVFGLSS